MGDGLFEGFEALLQDLGAPELTDGLTVQELALKTGRSVEWIRSKLKLLAAAGRLVVGRKKAMGLDGRDILVPAYKIKPAEAAKKK